jgi:serine/threonine-protein kinase
VLQASIATYMACAIVKRGAANEAYCWGRNDYGNLGTGGTASKQYPTKVTALTAPTAVTVVDYTYALSAGGTACAVDGGQVLCWGANGSGETGTGKTGALDLPTKVVIQDGTTALPAPIDMVSATGGTFCALASNKTIWCWGVGFNARAGNYGATNVAGLGGLYHLQTGVTYPRFATTDGQYHWGMEWGRSPNCTL